jgi:hypothetical protein
MGLLKNYNFGGIQISLWENESNGKKNTNYKIQKTYFDKSSNEWKKSDNYFLDDIKNIAFICNTIIMQEITKEKQKSNNNNSNNISDPWKDESTPF